MMTKCGDRKINKWSLTQLMRMWPRVAKLQGLGPKDDEARRNWGNAILVPKFRPVPAASWKDLTMQQAAILRSIMGRLIVQMDGPPLTPLGIQGRLFE